MIESPTSQRRSRTWDLLDRLVKRMALPAVLTVVLTTALLWATPAPAAEVHSNVVKATHHTGAAGALPARCHKRTKQRFNRRFGRLTAGTPRRTNLPVAGRVVAQQSGSLDAPARRRDHARAPPALTQPS